MRAFLDALDARLVDLASSTPDAPPQTEPPRQARRLKPERRRPWSHVAAGFGVAAAGGLVAVALTAGSNARLPVLGAPNADASAISGKPGVPPADRFDLTAGRTFVTPDGPGYLVASHDGRRVCVVLPDRDAPGTYGSSCASAARVSAGGLPAEMIAAGYRDTPGRSLVAFVLPTDAGPSATLSAANGAAVPVQVTGGVAVATLSAAATLHFTVRGTGRQHRFEAPFYDRSVTVDCGDHTVELPAPKPARLGGKPWHLKHRAQVCS